MTTYRNVKKACASLALVAALVPAMVACGDDAKNDPWASLPTKNGVGRIELGEAAPPAAPGNNLYLQRAVIDPGTALPRHFHEGTQVARVEAGVLTYNIVSGNALVTRADGSSEVVQGPATVKLATGDGVTETPELVHYGANDGKERVVITLAALLKTGAPMATSTS